MKSFGRHWATGLVLATLLSSVDADDSFFVNFDDSECATPTSVTYVPIGEFTCAATECSTDADGKVGRFYCSTDRFALASSTFGKALYLVQQSYNEETCTTTSSFQAFSADGKCHVGYGISFTATLNSDGSGALVEYSDGQCKESLGEYAVPKDKLATHDCVGSKKYYAFNAATAATSTSTGAGTSAAAPLLMASSLLAAFLGGLAVVLL
ncbi:hypothetical protein PF010_g29494 [Phytophthora fragariae]|uniref:Uncharacterized protein n=1 Tax=Phytophthora fragariae TaxID=53985 RepID=A0A6A3H4U0_9STRA|nr:hypothetical protein PF011_g28790 [Phytophthora fragariae]KAE9062222.1 hypothetical protein PF010_g29494 [Phytophthora fragariae]KAE9167030.1 hypothetical protein PF004_g28961 [Phytophthora fragariae]